MKTPLRVWGTAGALTVLAMWLGAFAYWSAAPGDDGPFLGESKRLPQEAATQEMALWAGKTLKVFQRAETARAPIVALVKGDGDVQWAVEATARGECIVKALHFQKYATWWPTPRLVGTVDWNCGGVERTVWYIRRDGELDEYWYSW